jgi:hypothetical protein
MNEKVLDLPILAPISYGHVGETQNLSSPKEPSMDKLLAAEVPSHSHMTEPLLFREKTDFFPIEGQDLDLIEPISISPGGMDINISVSIESDCIPRIEVSESPVLLEEEMVFGPIEADRTNGAKEKELNLYAQEKLIITSRGHNLPSVWQLPFLHVFPPYAAFSFVRTLAYPYSFHFLCCPFFIILCLLALPSPLTLWTTGNLLIPMEGIWRRPFDSPVLPFGIVMDPPLSLGPLPHSSDPPSAGINYMWKWAYSL